jgi:hypothetical protein
MEPGSDTRKYGLISAEYSASLQMHVLGLDLRRLEEPILDLGCGAKANMVRALREAGKAAYGVDLAVEEGLFLHKSDWFDYPLVSCAWGTVISHQGFANQFLKYHLKRDGERARFARRYMEILWSIKAGGEFIYAPGLPFVEDLLPADRFVVTRRSIKGLKHDLEFESLLEKALGSNPVCACRIMRI